MPRDTCLTAEELTAFHLGNLPEPTLEELAGHLESCPHCEASAAALDGLSDPVMTAYRHSALGGSLDASVAPPARVGEYEVLDEVGRGGMGVVYRARHLRLQRVVALKMLIGGLFVAREERARFRAEAEAVARLQHPNIVQIYEVGEHDLGDGLPRPYFTLEYASGGNLAARLASRLQAPRQAAAWLEPLARATHYAHEQGIIHRDLKPSNVLLTDSGEPKLCDFGVAKLLTGSDVQTRSGTLLGTAEYMAPEQTADGAGVGPSADTYALGAILYTVLTGRPPFQGTNTLDTLQQVRNREPVPPRRLLPHLPRDLDTICLKCLEKEPSRRYPSAAALADDLQRFLEGRPIVARPVGTVERVAKWVRRRPAVAGLVTAVVLLAALGVALVFGLWRGAEARAKIARENEEENLRLLADVTLDHGLNLCARGEVNRGLLLLARALGLAERAGEADLARAARVNLAVWRRRLVTLRATLPHDGWAWAVAFSPDGRTALTGGKDRAARRWDTRTGQPIGQPLRHRHPVWAVSFSPDGRTILTGSGDDKEHEGEVRLWDAASGEPLGPPLPHPDEVHVATFSPDGRSFLTACDEEVRVWQLGGGRPAGLRLPHPQPARRLEQLQPRLWAVFSPDGRLVLTGGEDGTARLWDAATGAPRGVPLRHDGPVLSVAFSPDGGLMATGCYDGTARLWDVATGRQRGPDLMHLGRVHAVALRFDNEFLVTGSSVEDRNPRTGERTYAGGEVRLWRVATGKLFGEPMRLPEPVWSVAFRPGGGKLLAGARDHVARFYSIVDGSILGKPLDHEGNVANVVFSPNGRLALTASAGGDHAARARLWEVPPGDPVVWSSLAPPAPGGRTWVAALAPDGGRVVGVAGTQAREYAVVTGQPDPDAPVLRHAQRVRNAFYNPDGRTILTITDGYEVRAWDRASGRQVGGLPPGPEVVGVSFSADGAWVAITRLGRRVAVCRAATLAPRGRPLRLPPGRSGLTLAPDGRRGFAHVGAGLVREWDLDAGKVVREYKAPGPVRWVLFVAGRPVAFTGTEGHLGGAYDLETGRPLGRPLADLAGKISTLALSPDGRSILTGLMDRRTARLWDSATGKPVGPPLRHTEAVPVVAFTADGRRMMSGSVSGEFRSQEVPRPVPGDAERVRCWVEVLTGMTLDDRGAFRDLDADSWRQRRERLRRIGGPPDGADTP